MYSDGPASQIVPVSAQWQNSVGVMEHKAVFRLAENSGYPPESLPIIGYGSVYDVIFAINSAVGEGAGLEKQGLTLYSSGVLRVPPASLKIAPADFFWGLHIREATKGNGSSSTNGRSSTVSQGSTTTQSPGAASGVIFPGVTYGSPGGGEKPPKKPITFRDLLPRDIEDIDYIIALLNALIEYIFDLPLQSPEFSKRIERVVEFLVDCSLWHNRKMDLKKRFADIVLNELRVICSVKKGEHLKSEFDLALTSFFKYSDHSTRRTLIKAISQLVIHHAAPRKVWITPEAMLVTANAKLRPYLERNAQMRAETKTSMFSFQKNEGEITESDAIARSIEVHASALRIDLTGLRFESRGSFQEYVKQFKRTNSKNKQD